MVKVLSILNFKSFSIYYINRGSFSSEIIRLIVVGVLIEYNCLFIASPPDEVRTHLLGSFDID